MNTLAVSCLLAVGAMAQSSWPVASAATTYWATTAAHTHHHNHTTPTWSIYNTTVTSVMVVQTLTMTCEEATTLSINGHAYPATAGEVLVVTNCPCTVTTTMPTMTSSMGMPPVTALTLPIPPHATMAPSASMPGQVPGTPTGSAGSAGPATPSVVHVGSASLAGRDVLTGLLVSFAALVFGL